MKLKYCFHELLSVMYISNRLHVINFYTSDPVKLTRGSLCDDKYTNGDYYNAKKRCFCNGEICLVNGTKSSGIVYKNGKRIFFKCCGDCGDKISAEEDIVKIELDCSKDPIEEGTCETLSLNADCKTTATTRLDIFRTHACKELGFDAANADPIDSR